MGLFGNLLKVAIDVVETPIAVAKDVLTLGGSLNDQDEPYTKKKLEDLKDDIVKTVEDVDKKLNL